MAVDDADHTDDVRLSLQERLVLATIEAELRHDRHLARALRGAASPVWLPLAVVLMCTASVFLAVVGLRTSQPAVLWCFAGLWPLTVFQASRLVRRWTGPRGG